MLDAVINLVEMARYDEMRIDSDPVKSDVTHFMVQDAINCQRKLLAESEQCRFISFHTNPSLHASTARK